MRGDFAMIVMKGEFLQERFWWEKGVKGLGREVNGVAL